jgi:hypothetical protein
MSSIILVVLCPILTNFGQDKNTYYHVHFIRDQPLLVCRIPRSQLKGLGPKTPKESELECNLSARNYLSDENGYVERSNHIINVSTSNLSADDLMRFIVKQANEISPTFSAPCTMISPRRVSLSGDRSNPVFCHNLAPTAFAACHLHYLNPSLVAPVPTLRMADLANNSEKQRITRVIEETLRLAENAPIFSIASPLEMQSIYTKEQRSNLLALQVLSSNSELGPTRSVSDYIRNFKSE